MSSGQFLLTFFIGAAIAGAAGALLGRRVRVTADWRRFVVMGGMCMVIGGGVALADRVLTAEFLIALALAWFGALLCGFAGGQVLRVRRELAPPAESGPREPTL